jgi:hypothetical protein
VIKIAGIKDMAGNGQGVVSLKKIKRNNSISWGSLEWDISGPEINLQEQTVGSRAIPE